MTIDVLGADLDSDTSNFEATVNTETASGRCDDLYVYHR